MCGVLCTRKLLEASVSECSNKSSVLLVLLLKTKETSAAYYFEINIQSNMVPCFPLVISNEPCGCLQRRGDSGSQQSLARGMHQHE